MKSRHFYPSPLEREVLDVIRQAGTEGVTVKQLKMSVSQRQGGSLVSNESISNAVSRLNQKAGAEIIERVRIPLDVYPRKRGNPRIIFRDALTAFEV